MKVRVIVFCLFLLCFFISGCGSIDSASSDFENTSSNTDSIVSSEVIRASSLAPSSSAVSVQPDVTEDVLMRGKTIVEVCNDYENTFILTADREVYYYGTYQRGLESISNDSKIYEDRQKRLFEIVFPEPIVKIVPYAAVGESGILYIYLYPATMSWSGYGAELLQPITEIRLEKGIKDICYHIGDFFIVFDDGTVCTIGEMTLYGQGFSGLDQDNLLKPIQTVVPESIEQIVASEHTVFIRGQSGAVYFAFHYFATGDNCIPDSAANEFPYSYDEALFQRVDAGTVKQISMGRDMNGQVIYLLKADGSVLYWKADQETSAAYTPGQAGRTPTQPIVSFTEFELGEEPVSEIVSTAFGGTVCFLTESGKCYLFQYGELVENFDYNIQNVCLASDGIFFEEQEGADLYYFGRDYHQLFVIFKTGNPELVTWLECEFE